MLSEMPIPGAPAVSGGVSGEVTSSGQPRLWTRDRSLRCRYSATFEFETDSPVTVRGHATAGSIVPILRQAVRELHRAASAPALVLGRGGVRAAMTPDRYHPFQ